MTSFSFVRFFAVILAFWGLSLSAKTVTIESGSNAGRALGNVLEVTSYSWTHKSSGKIFKSASVADMSVWGKMPPGEYELVLLDSSSPVESKKTSQNAPVAAMMVNNTSSNAPTATAVDLPKINPTKKNMAPIPAAAEVNKLNNTALMALATKDYEGQENDPTTLLLRQQPKQSTSRSSAPPVPKTEVVRKTNAAVTATDTDPYAEIKKNFDPGIKEALKAAGMTNPYTGSPYETFEDFKGMYLSNACLYANEINIPGHGNFRCLNTKPEKVTVEIKELTLEELAERERRRHEHKQAVLIKFAAFAAVCIILGAVIVVISLKHLKPRVRAQHTPAPQPETPRTKRPALTPPPSPQFPTKGIPKTAPLYPPTQRQERESTKARFYTETVQEIRTTDLSQNHDFLSEIAERLNRPSNAAGYKWDRIVNLLEKICPTAEISVYPSGIAVGTQTHETLRAYIALGNIAAIHGEPVFLISIGEYEGVNHFALTANAPQPTASSLRMPDTRMAMV